MTTTPTKKVSISVSVLPSPAAKSEFGSTPAGKSSAADTEEGPPRRWCGCSQPPHLYTESGSGHESTGSENRVILILSNKKLRILRIFLTTFSRAFAHLCYVVPRPLVNRRRGSRCLFQKKAELEDGDGMLEEEDEFAGGGEHINT